MSPYHFLHRGVPKGKVNICRVWWEDSIKSLPQFYF